MRPDANSVKFFTDKLNRNVKWHKKVKTNLTLEAYVMLRVLLQSTDPIHSHRCAQLLRQNGNSHGGRLG